MKRFSQILFLTSFSFSLFGGFSEEDSLGEEKPDSISAFDNNIIDSLTIVSGTTTHTGEALLTITSHDKALTIGSATLVGNILLQGTGDFTFNGQIAGANVLGSLDLGASDHTFFISRGKGPIDTEIESNICGSGGVVKKGAGILAFSGSNTYTGDTIISDGTLLYQGVDTISSASRVIVGSGNAPASLIFLNPMVDTSLDLTINSKAVVTQTSNNAVRLSALQGSGLYNLAHGISSDNLLLIQASNDMHYSGVIAGGTTNLAGDPTLGNRILKAGPSTLTLSGASNFLTPLFIQEGVVDVTSGAALGSSGSSSAVYVLAADLAGSLYVENNITLPKTLFLNGPGYLNSGALRSIQGHNIITGNVQMGWNGGTVTSVDPVIYVDAGSSLVLSEIVQGFANPTLTGEGTLVYAGTSANTCSGTLTIQSGMLQLNKTAGLNAIAGPLVISGGTVQLLNANQTSHNTCVTINGGTFDLNHHPDTIGSLQFVHGNMLQKETGTLSIASPESHAMLLKDSVVIPGNIAFVSTGGITTYGTSGMAMVQGSVDLASHIHTFDIDPGVGLKIQGSIKNTGQIIKTNNGTLELSGSSHNIHTGTTTVDAGILLLNKTNGAHAIAGSVVITEGTVQLANPNQFSKGATVHLLGGTFDLKDHPTQLGSLIYTNGSLVQGANGTLSFASDLATALTLSDNIVIKGDIAFLSNGGITFNRSNGIATIQGNVDLGEGFSHSIDIIQGSTSLDLDIQGAITGTGHITKASGGVMQFSGAGANTYAGTTTIDAGTLLLNKTSDAPAITSPLIITGGTVQLLKQNQFGSSATVTIRGGHLDLGNHETKLGSLHYLSGSLTQGKNARISIASIEPGALTLGANVVIKDDITFIAAGGVTLNDASGAATLQGNIDLGIDNHPFHIGCGHMDIQGPISNAGHITKTGPGVLELSGKTANTYTGTTKVQEGSLLLNKPAGVNAIAGNLVVNGGQLLYNASEQIAEDAHVTLDSGTICLGKFSDTIASLVINSGHLLQTEGSTLALISPKIALSMQGGASTSLLGNIILRKSGTIFFDNTVHGTAIIGSNLDLGGSPVIFDIGTGTSVIDMQVLGTISNGSLVKNNLGTLALNGLNTYSGGTTINAGAVRASAKNIPGNVFINHEAALVLTETSIANFTGQISGKGFVNIVGPGTITFSGPLSNTFEGLTTVSQGNLVLNRTEALAISGDLLVDGGVVTQLMASQISPHTNMRLVSGCFDSQDFPVDLHSLTYTGGSLTLNKSILSLNSTKAALTLGDTLINGQVDLIGSGAPEIIHISSGNAQIAKLNVTQPKTELTLHLNGNGTLTLLSSSSKQGGFIQKGNSTLILAKGLHDFSKGASHIQGGTISVWGNLVTSSLHIEKNAKLKGNGTITGSVTVSGTLKPGASIGTLHIIGSQTFASGSNYQVEFNEKSADLLKVTGAIGTIEIQPGATITLQPETGAIFNSPTEYIILQASDALTGQFSHVNFQGPVRTSYNLTYGASDLTLQLGTTPLSALLPSLTPAKASLPSTPTETLETTPSVATPIATSSPAITPALINSANSSIITPPSTNAIVPTINKVYITSSLPSAQAAAFINADITAGSVLEQLNAPDGSSGNVATVASVLDQLNLSADQDLASVITSLYNQNSVEALVYALNQLQPSMLKGLTNIGAQNAAIRNQRIIDQRFNQILTSDCSQKKFEKELSIWTDLMGDYLHQVSKSLQPGFNISSGSMALGLDYIHSQFFVGFASSYQYSNITWKYGRGHGNINSIFGNLYGGWCNEMFFADIAIQGGYNHFNETRHIGFSGVSRYAKGNFNGGSFLSSLGTGMIFHAAKIEFRPFIAAEYIYLHQQAFHESGAGSLNLQVESSNENMVRAETGLHFSRCFPLKKYNIRLDGTLSYIREQRFQGATYKTAFAGTDQYFTTQGINPDRNLFSPGCALTIFSHGGRYGASVIYQGEVGSTYSNQNGQFQFGYRF